MTAEFDVDAHSVAVPKYLPQIEIFYAESNSSDLLRLQNEVNTFIKKSGKVSRVIQLVQSVEANYSYTGEHKEDGFPEPGRGETTAWLILTLLYEST